MKYNMLLLLVLLFVNGRTQSITYSKREGAVVVSKPPLNLDSIKDWPQVALLKVSNNGKYCGYVIDHNLTTATRLILISTVKNWKVESTIISPYSFSANADKAVWINSNDSLCIATLGTYTIQYVPHILSFNVTGDYLTYQPKYTKDELVIINLRKRIRKEHIPEKVRIVIGNRQLQLLLKKNNDKNQLILRSGKNGYRERIIWEGEAINNIIKDDKGGQMAFVSGNISNTLFYYKLGMNSVVNLHVPIDSAYIFGGLSHFSSNHKCLFLNLIERSPIISQEASILNVWSYTDSKLQSQQLTELSPRQYTGAIRLSDHHFFRLDSGNDWLFFPTLLDSVALIRHQEVITPVDEVNWNIHSEFSWYIVSMKDGRRVKLIDIGKNWIVQLSPLGKYVIYYDSKKKDYFIYETENGNKRCLTNGIEENWEKNKDDDSYGKYIAAWGMDDAFVFVNGKRDIWQIDLTRSISPINLTNGYGNKHNIIFSLSLEEYARKGIFAKESILLTAFNLDTKTNGFYRKFIGKKGDPDSLSMGPYVYDIKDNPDIPQDINYSPVKASNAKKYVVRRMSAKEAPNFFLTTDFRSFRPLSNVQPHLPYNWYNAELHEWKSLDNIMLQGILYKPEDFDSTKKYPVIFYYYEKRADGLNVYLKPNTLDNGCGINIPYYVSNGYLVFCPDIRYPFGDPMQGTYDAVISAANYVGGLSYVDSKRMGVQGCSWGAIQTNYIITHTSLFAAACSASGIANWVSDYGNVAGTGESMQGMFEIGQFRMGATLWEKPELYIKNSPIFQAKAITTPLLVMHTTKDMICDLSNIEEFFTALCFLRKKSWMLLYKGNHGLYGLDAVDFSLRMKQFFDHYLFDCPEPKWMATSHLGP